MRTNKQHSDGGLPQVSPLQQPPQQLDQLRVIPVRTEGIKPVAKAVSIYRRRKDERLGLPGRLLSNTFVAGCHA
jgi:hypothetical protein